MYISGKNYFNEKCFKRMCNILEDGREVEVGITCIGHTRNNMEQEAYKEALLKKYGDNLEVKRNEGLYCYSYSYKLEEVKYER